MLNILLSLVLSSTGGMPADLSEVPPCRGAALTDQQVFDIAISVLDASFMQPEGMPPRPWRVQPTRCIYYFEYVVLSYDHSWFGIDAIDATGFLEITREGKVYRSGKEVTSERTKPEGTGD
ncbi:MAG TPA: hypothetical protein VIZ64_07865 [Dokdonella sp.]